jgi:hypothetical protein
MLRLLLIRLWPALIPIALYLLWVFVLRKEKVRHKLTEGPLFWTLVTSVLLAVGMLFWYGINEQGNWSGTYVPPQGGGAGRELVPGQVVPKE